MARKKQVDVEPVTAPDVADWERCEPCGGDCTDECLAGLVPGPSVVAELEQGEASLPAPIELAPYDASPLTFGELPLVAKVLLMNWLGLAGGLKGYQHGFRKLKAVRDAEGVRYSCEVQTGQNRGKVLLRVVRETGDEQTFKRHRDGVLARLAVAENVVNMYHTHRADTEKRHAEFYELIERRGQEPHPKQAEFFADELAQVDKPLALAKERVRQIQAELEAFNSGPTVIRSAFLFSPDLTCTQVE